MYTRSIQPVWTQKKNNKLDLKYIIYNLYLMYLPYAKANQCVQVVYSIFGIIFNRFELK